MTLKHVSKYMFYKEGFDKPELADVTHKVVKEVMVSLVPNSRQVVQFDYVLDHTVFDDRNPRNLTPVVDANGKVRQSLKHA